MGSSVLMNDIFDWAGGVRSGAESSALHGHFEPWMMPVPLVAIKAAAGAFDVITKGLTVSTKVHSPLLPWERFSSDMWMVVTETGRKVAEITKDVIAEPEVPKFVYDGKDFQMVKQCERIQTPGLIPQWWDFLMADCGIMTNGNKITGSFRVPSTFRWQDKDGRIDPAVLEEVAAQIVSMGYARWKNVSAREYQWDLVWADYPTLTFISSDLTFHTNHLPYTQDAPTLFLTGEVVIGEWRRREVVYLLTYQYAWSDYSEPLISWRICANEMSAWILRRSLQRIEAGYAIGNSAKVLGRLEAAE